MGMVSGLYFEDQVSSKACQLLQCGCAQGIGVSEGVVMVTEQSRSKEAQQGICHGFALLCECYPRQYYMQQLETIATEVESFATDFKNKLIIFKQKGNTNSSH